MLSDEEVLDKASELIEKGWCQGAFHTPALANPEHVDQYCIEGALRVAVRDSNETSAASAAMYYLSLGSEEEVQHYRLSMLLSDFWGVPGPRYFNDRESTSKEDVLLGIKKVREQITT